MFYTIAYIPLEHATKRTQHPPTKKTMTTIGHTANGEPLVALPDFATLFTDQGEADAFLASCRLECCTTQYVERDFFYVAVAVYQHGTFLGYL